jgi:glucosamine--fructose-6-phosphate aminotransferase (isomerizing)
MCGIVGYVGKQKATSVLVSGLEKLEYRGYDSAGVAVHNGSELLVKKAKGRLKILEGLLDECPLEGSVGIGHTRWATHGAPSDINSHPHVNTNSTIAVVHNGIIENYLTIKEELEAQGYKFVSETDTETAAQLIDFYYKQSGDLLEAVFKAIEKIEGSYALGVVCKDCPDQIIAARKDSPLIIGLGEGENFIASDVPAILQYTRDIYYLDDKEIAVLTRDSVEIYNMKKEKVHKEVSKITWDAEAAEKGGYEHFMLKEIFEQPKVVKDTLLSRVPEDSYDVNLGVNLNKEDLQKINKIYIVACGTAYYAGTIGKYIIQRVSRIPVETDVASEFRYRDPILDENTLVIVVSQSGETADTLAALRLAKAAGSKVMAVVNVVGSSIAREADEVIYTMAGPEIAVASTKAYSSQLVVMYLIAIHIARQLGNMSDEEFAIVRDELHQLPSKIDNILKRSHRMKEMAEKYLDAKNVFYIGRGLDNLVSLEGSLKLKEIAYLHSESYAAGELKHGPIALMEDRTLVIGLITHKELMEKTVSNIKEVKARSARVLAIAQQGDTDIEKVVDDVIYVPQTHWMFTSILANIPQQIFAYYMAIGLGNDVDKPRNLAKSVTVE